MSPGVSGLERPLVRVGCAGMREILLVEGTLVARAGGSSGDLNQAACPCTDSPTVALNYSLALFVSPSYRTEEVWQSGP